MSRYFLSIAWLVASLPTLATAQVPVIELMAVSPTGGKAGTQVDFRVASATRGEEVDALRFSHPGITAELKTNDPLPFRTERQPAHGHFKVNIGADVPSGRYEVRAVGRHGVSNPRSFSVHNFASEKVVTPSHNRRAPTELQIGELIHAKTTNSAIDAFRFKATAGSRLQFDVFAARLDSRAILQVEVVDSQGRVVRSAHGSDELDPELVIDVDREQMLTIVVSDMLFRGGDDYAYQLVVRDTAKSQHSVWADDAAQSWFVRNVSNLSDLVASAVQIEEISDAKQIEVPCKITAKFDSRNDVDVYQFSATEGQTWSIDLVSQRLGQPTDVRIVVERSEPQPAGDPRWVQVAVDDDSNSVSDGVLRLNTNDPMLTFKAPKTTNYRVSVRDLDTGDALRKTQRYWMQINQPQPAFDLVVYPHYPHRDVNQHHQRGSSMFRGGSETLRVFAVRRGGFKGAITLAAQGLPAGVSCQSAILAAGRDQVEMTLSASETAPPGFADIQIVGTATFGDKPVSVTAKAATLQWGKGGSRAFNRCRLSQHLTIGVSDKDIAGITFTAVTKTLKLKKGAELKLPVQFVRRDNAKNDCQVRPLDLPPNVSAKEIKIAKDKSAGELVLQAKANATPGTYSFWLQTETTIKLKANPQAHERAKVYRAELQKLNDDPANKEKLPAIQAAIKTADARIKSSEASAKEQEIVVFVASPHINIEIVP